MREAQRGAMRNLPLDRKLFLIRQHNHSSFPIQEPLRSTKTGPETDSGTLASLKRFSLANVVWGGTVETESITRPATMYHQGSSASASTSTTSIASLQSPDSNDSTNEKSPNPSNWNSWWSSASNATGTGHSVGEQAKDTPQFYVDQLKSG